VAVGRLLIPWILWELLSTWLVGGRGIAVAAHGGGFALGAGAGAFLRSARSGGTGWFVDPLPSTGGGAVVQRLHEAQGRPRA